MSNRLPYKNNLAEQMENIPLPDMDMAWADMKRRLEDKKDDKVIFPIWLSGCAIWALVAGLLCVGCYFWYRNYSMEPNNKIATDSLFTITKKISNQSDIQANNNNTIKVDSFKANKNTINADSLTKSINKISEFSTATKNMIFKKGVQSLKKESKPNTVNLSNKQRTKIKGKSKMRIVYPNEIKDDTTNEAFVEKKKNKRVVNQQSKINISSPNAVEEAFVNEVEPTSPEVKSFASIAKKDTSIIKADTTNKKSIEKSTTSDSTKPNKKVNKTNSKLFFNAGIAMQQQLPFNGEKLTAFNSLGRKGTLLDYIPSVYVRLEKHKKWFIQLEGKYGAPQYNKGLVYNSFSIPDTGFNPRFVNTTSVSLKKSFYHQVPLSFNYYLTPKWSIGTGLQWNKFVGAIAETDVVRKNNLTQTDSSINKFISLEKGDSTNVFAKSYFLGIIESQYKWRRFSFGAKYTFGLSPYIIFTLPGATEKKLSSKVTNVFIRYELWSSKKKNYKTGLFK
jgi:hypothetical protein